MGVNAPGLTKPSGKPIFCMLGLHNWGGLCICQKCQKNRKHVWDGCKCTRCGQIRAEGHRWVGCLCSKCNSTNHKWVGIKCAKCRETNTEKIRWAKTTISSTVEYWWQKENAFEILEEYSKDEMIHEYLRIIESASPSPFADTEVLCWAIKRISIIAPVLRQQILPLIRGLLIKGLASSLENKLEATCIWCLAKCRDYDSTTDIWNFILRAPNQLNPMDEVFEQMFGKYIGIIMPITTLEFGNPVEDPPPPDLEYLGLHDDCWLARYEYKSWPLKNLQNDNTLIYGNILHLLSKIGSTGERIHQPQYDKEGRPFCKYTVLTGTLRDMAKQKLKELGDPPFSGAWTSASVWDHAFDSKGYPAK